MLLDSSLIFCDKQAIRGDSHSENTIDLGPLDGNTLGDIGAGEELHLSVVVTETFVTANLETSTLTASLWSSDTLNLPTKGSLNATFTSDLGAKFHWTSARKKDVALVEGFWFAEGVAIPTSAFMRYLFLTFYETNNDPTAGAISAWLHYGHLTAITYASGFSTRRS